MGHALDHALDQASDAERHRQLDGRSAEADQFAQVAGPHRAIGRELDRRHIGADRAQIVGGRVLDQLPGAVRAGGDRGAVQIGGPAAVGAAVHHGAVADPVGSHHYRSGDFQLFLFQRRSHGGLIAKNGVVRGRNPSGAYGRITFYIVALLAPQIAVYSTNIPTRDGIIAQEAPATENVVVGTWLVETWLSPPARRRNSFPCAPR